MCWLSIYESPGIFRLRLHNIEKWSSLVCVWVCVGVCICELARPEASPRRPAPLHGIGTGHFGMAKQP